MRKSLIQKNRELLESEKGAVFKDPGGRLGICLVYPNTYHVGMSNLGFTGLYTLLNSMDGVVCERVFLPEKNDIDRIERTRSRLVSFESGRPLNSFDAIAFSVSFENDYPNVLKILGLAKIGYYSRDRGDRDPLIIMGGPCAFINPEPLADFMDVVFIGEAENEIDDLVRGLGSDGHKTGRLKSLSGVNGCYIPSFYEPTYSEEGKIIKVEKIYPEAPGVIKRVYVNDLNKTILTSRLSTPHTEFKDMYLIEAMRGCPFSCRFCVAGHVYDPPRQRKPEVLTEEIENAREKGLKVGLIAPSLTEYRGITGLLDGKDVHFSITSLRASKRSAEIVKMLKNGRSVSIAPEAGSQRLRDVIKKKISEDDILETSELILKSNIKNLKLYFMAGLPTETQEDIDAIIELVKKIRSLSKKGTISLTLSIFVPKPFTPFQ
ncbi:MAG TPA: radical SAM protein, partial [Nitrospirae bacterium]|nr:radical SAM protein [Nitrospirota bacterium]